jgi:hypothetical protein
MFSYCAYGLCIHSDLALPGLVASEARAEPDVFVRLGRVNRMPPKAEHRGGCFHATSDEAYFFWEEGGVYLVRGGREIIVEPAPGVEEWMLCLVVLGVALGVLLHQRGLLTLHASAVAVDGAAVAFLGGKGAGKSTTAAALHIRGYSVVADDVVALDVGDTASPMLLPGVPRLKLWPEVAALLGDEPDALPRIHPQLEKRARLVAYESPQVPLPLRCIYVLAEGTHLAVETLQAREIFLEMVGHSYALRFLGTAGVTASHFHQCVRLANSVPVRRLKRPRSLSALPGVARLVREHFASDTRQATGQGAQLWELQNLEC